MKVEDTSMIYYMDEKGIVQDGNQWLEDVRNGEIGEDYLDTLVECFWSALNQQWEKE